AGIGEATLEHHVGLEALGLLRRGLGRLRARRVGQLAAAPAPGERPQHRGWHQRALLAGRGPAPLHASGAALPAVAQVYLVLTLRQLHHIGTGAYAARRRVVHDQLAVHVEDAGAVGACVEHVIARGGCRYRALPAHQESGVAETDCGLAEAHEAVTAARGPRVAL